MLYYQGRIPNYIYPIGKKRKTGKRCTKVPKIIISVWRRWVIGDIFLSVFFRFSVISPYNFHYRKNTFTKQRGNKNTNVNIATLQVRFR